MQDIQTKEIKGFPSYGITVKGEVVSYKRKEPHFLHAIVSRNGYKGYCLSEDGITQTLPIYYLLALAYIPNPDNKKTVTAKDGDLKNLDITNLEWT